MLDRWQVLVARVSDDYQPDAARAAFDDLITRYTTAERRYHDFRHIKACLRLLDTVRGLARIRLGPGIGFPSRAIKNSPVFSRPSADLRHRLFPGRLRIRRARKPKPIACKGLGLKVAVPVLCQSFGTGGSAYGNDAIAS